MKTATKQLTLTALLAVLSAGFLGCGTAKVSGRREIAAISAGIPTVVYVSDFDLDAASIKSEPGVLPPPPKLPGPLGGILPPPPGAPKDPQLLARELVESMNESLVRELAKAGLTARRLAPGASIPHSGWLVRGVFTDVNQGNQLRRAVIGFGLGKTDLQVVVDIADLAHGTPKKFYELNTTADSGTAPGAGPTMVLGPAGVAARFVMAGKDLDRSVKQTASKIAAEVVARTKPTSQPDVTGASGHCPGAPNSSSARFIIGHERADLEIGAPTAPAEPAAVPGSPILTARAP